MKPGELDRWRSDQVVDAQRAEELADFVETRARSADEVETRRAVLALLELQPGTCVLEVGAGTGVVTRDLARLVAPHGKVTAVEPNPSLRAIAARLAAEAGVAAHIDWQAGDARKLPFADESFDVVLAATVLAHIPDSAEVVPELVRVLKRGGTLGVLEIDPESFLLHHPDRALTRRILAAATDAGFADAFVARRLPALLRAAGVSDLKLRAFTSLETSPDGFVAKAARLRPTVALAAGAISQAEALTWQAQLDEEIRAGRFFGGTSYVFAWAKRAF